MISIIGIIKQILYMRCRKMKIFHLSHCFPEPFLLCYVHIFFFSCNRHCLYQIAIAGITGNADQILFIGIIQKVHLLYHILRCQILILDHRIIHGIRDPTHIFKITFQIDRCLIQKLHCIFRHHCFHSVSEQMVHGNTESSHGK